MPKIKTTVRVCLKCGNNFNSKGPGNRICRKCSYINRHSGISELHVQSERGAKYHNNEKIS